MREWKGVAKNLRGEASNLYRQKEYRSPWVTSHILLSLIWPFLLYAYVYYFRFCSLRFYHPYAALWLGPGLGMIVAIMTSAWALFAYQRQSMMTAMRERMDPNQQAMAPPVRPVRSSIALAVCCWVALIAAFVQGDQNYHWYVISYYDFQDLASYVDIDPRTDMGQSYMDAGQVYFRDGTWIAKDDLITFRHTRLYCAAPIVGQPIWNQAGGATGAMGQPAGGAVSLPQSGTVDFWAVGVDCCDEARKTFTCGHAADPRARAGIRMLRDDIRPFFALAVQQWVARLCPLDENTERGQRQLAPLTCLGSKHPLFFHWVVDPLAEVDGYNHRADSLFTMHLLMYFMGDLALVLVLLWGMFTLGVK
jgi:hypothetical protein